MPKESRNPNVKLIKPLVAKMLSGNRTEELSIQANVTIQAPGQNSLKMTLPLSRSPRVAKAILVHKARGEGQGEGTCSILCNVSRVKSSPTRCFGFRGFGLY